jgi:hypothetical protein
MHIQHNRGLLLAFYMPALNVKVGGTKRESDIGESQESWWAQTERSRRVMNKRLSRSRRSIKFAHRHTENETQHAEKQR